ncbi:sigma-70 family RNA polymerase sigma factor [Flavitalea sp. BT771]|uniref:RNA polymerase sigma factor n=1 Tax=Flavitalea sp. BT771 TaxID=3063329 RepID=UPI0026E246E4|nr:sigma-70 family RNA polymerase sigma factor [Flavitalea sp. BT771]MDO6429355.1 sigma-70 family RNA polymerase sigma factor [Flavitalea sp. BT771]MDV6218517.1 sigma-70 family RNA polymerase sigma factor [Flavitalea sp. BT771]
MISSDGEKILFQQAAEGNEQAFGALFNLFLPRLYPFIIKLTRSESAVQEIIQETFIKAWLNRDKLAEMENPGGWLFRVASNKCYDHLRARVLNDKFFKPITTDPEQQNAPHEWLDAKELMRLVGEAVHTLPAQRKKIYLMSREQGKTIPEIAAALQISPHTVKNALVTSLKLIREYLARHGVIFFILNFFLF